ncbi:SWIM zinc finger family protein [Streptomyces sp. NPDC050504]|uniref:SWIM zinc finger family protein n=1 Tax=Streptomyces sp. NPDC050504 TaxID=3365618 RepID=UPI0037A19B20
MTRYVDDRRRTFESAPQGPETWWGTAWRAALEALSLDPRRLARGSAYADEGNVAAITVTPGRVIAYVHGSRPRPYRTEIRLRTLSDEQWETFLDDAAAHPAQLAALLDKDMPQALADTAEVPLLPGPGDLLPHCTCPDQGRPCKHTAALCYRTARLLDADPFVLLLMRGRGEREILDELSRRNASLAARERPDAPAMPTVLAREALAVRTLPPLPPPLPLPPHPGQPPAYPTPAAPAGGRHPGGAASGGAMPDPLSLDQLAMDAAAAAHAFLATGEDPTAGLTVWQDAVRLAAARPTAGLTATTRGLYRELAFATRRTPTDLARAVAAWRQGGREGLAVLEEPWDPPAGPFDRARPALAAAGHQNFRPWRNRYTGGSHQLRLGRDARWYGYESDADETTGGTEEWWPRGVPDADPVAVLRALRDG